MRGDPVNMAGKPTATDYGSKNYYAKQVSVCVQAESQTGDEQVNRTKMSHFLPVSPSNFRIFVFITY